MHHDDGKTFRLVEGIAAVHPDLVQLKQAAYGLRVPLSGKTQQSPPLIHLLFFSVGCRASFHLKRISFVKTNRWTN